MLSDGDGWNGPPFVCRCRTCARTPGTTATTGQNLTYPNLTIGLSFIWTRITRVRHIASVILMKVKNIVIHKIDQRAI